MLNRKAKKRILPLLRSLWFHMGPKRRKQYFFLMVLMVLSTFSEVISLGAVMPFLGVLLAPDQIFNSPEAQYFILFLDIKSARELVFPLTMFFICAAILAGILRFLLLWVGTKISFQTGADISLQVYSRILHQSFNIHVSRNSSDVVSSIVNRVNGVVFWVLLPVLTLISSSVLLVAITSALLVLDTVVASIAILGFGFCYGVISLLSREKLITNGHIINHEQTQVIKTLQEGLGGIRDVILDGTQSVFCDVYVAADLKMRNASSSNNILGGFPRPAMEALGVVLIATLAYWLSNQRGGIESSLPILGALAIGAQRLLPALQQAYGAWASIMGGKVALAETVFLLDEEVDQRLLRDDSKPINIRDGIQLENVRFRYSEQTPWVLDGVTLFIREGTKVGVVGKTGCGKSTFLDIVMGLLSPTHGNILIDGRHVTDENISAWRKSIAHVPQHIFLADKSFAENIAFGVPLPEIDMARVRDVASRACISDYIESIPEGYNSFVGERGVLLSGGQAQRIGIARALYKKAKVLILDEATSALDSRTEEKVMKAIDALDRSMIVIIVAHRLSTLKNCDYQLKFEDGKIVE